MHFYLRMRHFLYILTLTAAVFMAACSNNRSSYTPSSVAKLTGFRVVHDSFPNLSSTLFTIQELSDTGLVFNADSIAFATRIDSLATFFSFAATPGSATISYPDTTRSLTGSDTLNYTRQPIYLTIVSSDGTTRKVYELRVLVHQVDPDFYQWKQLSAEAYAEPAEGDQQLLYWHDMLYLYVGTGNAVHLFTSADGRSWTEHAVNLPAHCRVRSIVCDSVWGFGYAADTLVYQSADGSTWNAAAVQDSCLTMLFCFEDPEGTIRPWVLSRGTDANSLAVNYFRDGSLCRYASVPRATFPVSGYATVPFRTTGGRARMLLLGGYAEDGSMLRSRWNWEFVGGGRVDRMVRMTDYADAAPLFPCIAHSAVVWYDHKLLLFGAVDARDEYLSRDIWCSVDEGLHWSVMDTAHCRMPASFGQRKKVCAVVQDGTDIVVVGGSDRTGTYRDVYSGRVQSIGWNK